MTSVFRAIFVVLLLVGISGCGNKAIPIVQNSMTEDGTTIKQWVARIAGSTGKVVWDEFHPTNQPTHVRVVNAEIIRSIGQVDKKVKLQWIVNLDTDFSEMRSIEINGKPSSIILGVIELSLWPLADMASAVKAIEHQSFAPSASSSEEAIQSSEIKDCVHWKGNVYKCTREDGGTTYTNRPPFHTQP